MITSICFAAGAVIIAEDTIDLDLYRLERGKVELRRGDRVLAVISQAGAILGELASILHEPRSCSVVAVTVCRLQRISLTIPELVRKHPELAEQLVFALARRLGAASAANGDHDAAPLVLRDDTVLQAPASSASGAEAAS